MSGFIVDASVAASWLLPDEFDARAATLRQRLAAEPAHVPAVWLAEIANALLIAERRERIDADFVRRALDELGRSPIVVDTASRDRTWSDALQLARDHRLTVYDATYLELALRLSLPLATLDKRLYHAAAQAGVEMA